MIRQPRRWPFRGSAYSGKAGRSNALPAFAYSEKTGRSLAKSNLPTYNYVGQYRAFERVDATN